MVITMKLITTESFDAAAAFLPAGGADRGHAAPMILRLNR